MSTDSESMGESCNLLFSYLGENPGTWWLSSSRLKQAADTLRDNCWPEKRKHRDLKTATADFRFGPVYMLLMGMAIEAALKAVLVAEHPELIEPQGISKTLATHHLRDLWARAGLARPNSQQRDSLLGRLESFVVIFGRYPVPKSERSMDRAKGSCFHADPDFDDVTRLWVSLENQMKKALPEAFNEDGANRNGHLGISYPIRTGASNVSASTQSGENSRDK